MDQLLAKLTNLGYEFFGVVLPGIVTVLFLVCGWGALGPLPSFCSFGVFPDLSAQNAARFFERLSVQSEVSVAVSGFAIVYFVGHIVLWISRASRPDDGGKTSAPRRIWTSLVFKIPRPKDSYDSNLEELFQAVNAKFSINGTTMTWRQFYPVVKSFLSKNLTYSLVATYQNKYTLHRSITAAAALLFWLTVVGAMVGIVTGHFAGVAPRWGLLITLACLALVLVWGFSDSYAYHWKMFGNTIITEAYSVIYGPNDAQQSK
ncbi:MAG: hypothetical protein AW10_03282 [Candidatus Accumulibacter appositus]|uniref:Uncharacterized protein n=1 Tax=Candidatus Accumulibacter appositus TaxID=1454003 RepID=A0A011N6F7_9PROT|nr:hypothetical protein [Accumulibacter sp.]EXI78198.1 MAG: hypothetical protein AW10_03282 [Candidatus Accumulibacter appositus]HRF04674.1 hypothetical protein [Accumulibacter sp.]